MGGCQKGQFCFSFSFPLIPLSIGQMSESIHHANRKLCLFFLSLSQFPAGFPCWADSPQSCGVTGAVAGSPEWCWGDVMFCQMDVAPVQSLLGLHAMGCICQWLPSSAVEKIVLGENKYRCFVFYKSSKWLAVPFKI